MYQLFMINNFIEYLKMVQTLINYSYHHIFQYFISKIKIMNH